MRRSSTVAGVGPKHAINVSRDDSRQRFGRRLLSSGKKSHHLCHGPRCTTSADGKPPSLNHAVGAELAPRGRPGGLTRRSGDELEAADGPPDKVDPDDAA